MSEPRECIPEGFVRSKFNNTGVDIAAHTVVMLDSTEDYVTLTSATTDPIYGVAVSGIPDGEWGDVQVMGRAKVLSGAAIAVPGGRVMADNTGRAIDWTAVAGTNANVLGLCETTASGAAEIVEVELAGPGTISQG